MSAGLLVQAQNTFQISYDIGLLDLMGSVKQLPNDHYIVSGSATGSGFLPLPNATLMQVDDGGAVVWANEYAFGNLFFTLPSLLNDARTTSDGGFIAGGSAPEDGEQALLMKTNATGAVTWAKGYGGGNSEFTNVVRQTDNGGYIGCGETTSFGSKDSSNIYIFRTNSSGTLTWDRAIVMDPARDLNHSAKDILEIPGDGFYGTGYMSQIDGADTTTNIIVFKLSPAGVVQWIRSYGDIDESEEAFSIELLPTSELLISGTTTASAGGLDGGDMFFMRTDLSGNITWSRAYDIGFADLSNNGYLTSDGNYLSVGWTIENVFPLTISAYALKVNPTTGAVIFAERYSMGIGNILGEGQETSDGGVVIAGMSGNLSWDFHLIKSDGSALSGCNQTSYGAAMRTYAPAATTPSPAYYNGGGTTNYSPDVSALTPTLIVDCIDVPCVPPTTPTASASDMTICQGSSTTLNGSGSGAGITYQVFSAASGGNSLGETPLSVSPSSTTTYYIEAQDALLCESERTPITITVLPVEDPSWTSPGFICLSNGIIDLSTFITGTTGGTFTGTGVSGNNFNPTGLGGQTITVTYEVGNNPCEQTQQQSISVVAQLDAAWNPPTSVCIADGTVNLTTFVTGNAGGTFNGTGVSGSTFDPSGLGGQTISIDYTVGANPCDETETQTITVLEDVDPSWTTTTICENGGTLDLTALVTGTTGGTWTVDGVGNNGTFDPTGSGGQTVSVTYTVGTSPCEEMLQQDITVEPESDASWTTPNIVCEAAGIINLDNLITGTTGGTWSGTGVSGSNFNPTSAGNGTHTITYVVGNQPCEDELLQDIQVESDVNVSWTTPGAICETDGVIDLNTLLTGDTGGTWSGDGVSGNIFDPTGLSGSVSVSYSLGNSPCTEIATESIEVTPIVSAEWSSPGVVCEDGGTINLDALVTGTSGGTWSGTGVTGSTFDPTGLDGTYQVSYAVGSQPCDDETTYEISVLPMVDGTWQAPSVLCEVEGILDLNALVTGTPGGAWDGTNVDPNGGTFDPTGLDGQNISITYTVGQGDCEEISTQNIQIENVDAAWVGPDTICESDGVMGLNAFVTGDAGGTWSGSGVSGNNFNPAGFAGSVTLMYAVGTLPCRDSISQDIFIHAAPLEPTVQTTDNEICIGETATLSASGSGNNITYNVYDTPAGGTLVGTTPFQVSPTATTTYYIIAENENGCTNLTGRQLLSVTVNPLPNVDAGFDVNICLGDTTTLVATGGGNYLWNTTEITENIEVNPQTGTIYSVTVTDANNCEASASVSVDVTIPTEIIANLDTGSTENVNPISVAVLENDTIGTGGGIIRIVIDPLNGTAQLESDNNITYTPDEGYVGADSLQYVICDAFCQNVCDTAWLRIEVIDEIILIIPSGFSPNGDQINDEFEIIGLDKFTENKLVVFNRWGNLIYEAEPYENDWHGQTPNAKLKVFGDEVVDGTYFYIFYYPDGTEDRRLNGTIELRRN